MPTIDFTPDPLERAWWDCKFALFRAQETAKEADVRAWAARVQDYAALLFAAEYQATFQEPCPPLAPQEEAMVSWDGQTYLSVTEEGGVVLAVYRLLTPNSDRVEGLARLDNAAWPPPFRPRAPQEGPE
jgi:hypothetical protein